MKPKKSRITVECYVDSRIYNILVLLAWTCFHIKGSLRYFLARIALYSFLIVSSIVCIPIFLLSPRNLKNSTFYAKYIGRHSSHLYGITWEIRGETYLSAEEGAVVVANHQHELDIIGMFVVWPAMEKCAAVSKAELLWSPFGLAAWLAGVVFINRGDRKSARSKINKTSRILREKTKIFMFPEGTRNSHVKETKKLLPFKKGAFRIAIEAQVPVIPIVFSPYYFVDDDQKVLCPGGRVIVSVLPPIPTLGLHVEDTERLIHSVRDQMQCEYNCLDEEIAESSANCS